MTTISLDEFIADVTESLKNFDRWKRFSNQEDPENNPLVMKDWDWWHALAEHDQKLGEDLHSCGETGYVLLSSLKVKYCNICDKKFPWELKPGQNPLISNNRVKSV